MFRIHPSESKTDRSDEEYVGEKGSLWTVWKKSSMAFQGTDGFSVYDSSGRLAYRVDNYSRRHKRLAGEVLLMDGDGKPLVGLRPQIFSMHDQWNAFRYEDGSKPRSKNHIFSMRKRSILQNSDETDVFMASPVCHLLSKPDFRIEGCFWRRCCRILRVSDGEVVAKISRKKANTSVFLGDDVFSLLIEPGVDCEMIMAFVVIIDRICHKPFSPVLCSKSCRPLMSSF